MSYPAYPEYKDSGVEWLGEVPAHWGIKKFRYLFQESGEKIEDEVVGEMLSVSGYRGIEVKKYEDENKKRTDSELSGYRIVRPSQLVVNTMWLNYAGLGVSSYEGHVSPAYRSYWINSHLNKRFIHHLMRSESYVKGYTKYLTGIRPNSLQMSRDDLMLFPVLLPSHYEQDVIASFLDHETARIDALVEEQQRLIALLKEKRQAVISHAVTKGLDPNVAMKDSGVKWLGEVPEHWEVLALRRVIKRVEQGWSPNASNVPAAPAEWGVVKLSAIKKGCFIEKENKALLSDTNPDIELEIRAGDLLVTRANTPELVGDACIVKPPSERKLMLSDLVYRLKVTKRADAQFICWFLISNSGRSQITSDARGSSMTMAKISQLHIKSWLLAVPPIGEQYGIASYVESELRRIDQLIRECVDMLQLLGERRSALISAAVTGKIDVRGWQLPLELSESKEEAADEV